MEFEKTSFAIYGVFIQEPVTALTDLLVSGVCLYAFFRLGSHNRAVVLMKYYFLTMAIATAYGGIVGHAFLSYLSFAWKVPGWLISMFSVALLERAAIAHSKPILPKKLGKIFMIVNIIELLSLATIVLITLNFTFVEAHAAYGLLFVVFSFELYVFRMTDAESSRRFMIAIGISAIAATVHLAQISPNAWFNHLDLSHVLMAASAFMFFRAGQILEAGPFLAKGRTQKRDLFGTARERRQATVRKIMPGNLRGLRPGRSE